MENLKKSFLVRGNNIVGFGGSGEENTIESISVNGVDIAPDENKNVDITVPSIDGLTKDADLATVAKSGDYEDLNNKPEIPSVEGLAKITDIPTKVSQLENDSNYLSSIPEEYVTETELNAKGYLTEHQDLSAYATKDEIPTVPSKVSELTNDSNYQTAEQVSSAVTTEIAKVVADAPEDFNTLKEMSDWIAGHEDDASAMNSAISDNKTAITALQTSKADKSEIPTTLPADGGNSDTVNNHTVEADVPTDAIFTDTIYDDTEVKGSIDELNSNLVQLEYSENGIENLLELMSKNETLNGVTLTNNGDGTLTFNGTSTNYPQFSICEVTLEAGNYKMSSFNYDGVNPFLWIGTSKKTNDIANGRWNTDVIFTLSETKTIYVTLVYTPNDNPQNKLVKPMIVKGNELPNTFRKYVKSNLQLTYDVADIKNDLVESADYLVPKKINDSSSVINGYVDMGKFYLGSSFGTVCVPCEKGKTYVITKKQGERFVVGTCNTIPTTGTIINNVIIDNKATELKVKNTDDNYVIAFVYNASVDTLPRNEIINSVVIKELRYSNVNLTEYVDSLNESLGDYGLNNVFDGVKQGYITVSTGDESDIDENCVKSIDKKSCKPNDKITIKTEKGVTWIGIAFYKADGTFLSGSEKKDLSKKCYEYTSTAPDNSAYYKYYVGILGEGITPQTVGHIGVYVNNTIDSLKNDLEWKLLADNVAIGTSTNVVSGAREYYVVAKYNTINVTTLIPSIVLGKTIFDGYYSSESDNSRIQINTTTSALSLASFIYGGSVKDDATYSVYYR